MHCTQIYESVLIYESLASYFVSLKYFRNWARLDHVIPVMCLVRVHFSDIFCNLPFLPPTIHTTMDLHDAQNLVLRLISDANAQFQKVPGSAILLRYIKSSYQNDPVRSAVELFLFLFAVRYLLAPAYSTQKQKHVALTEEVWHFLCFNLWIVVKGGL